MKGRNIKAAENATKARPDSLLCVTAMEKHMLFLKAVPTGFGYRRFIAFSLDLIAAYLMVSMLLFLFGESAQPLQIAGGFIVGAMAGWGFRRVFKEEG